MFKLLLAFIDPGSALLVLRDGKPVQIKVEGVADIQTGRKITAKTNFRLASITKQFTATAILLLAKDGEVRVDDDDGKHIPVWPLYANGVTIRHLLTHTTAPNNSNNGFRRSDVRPSSSGCNFNRGTHTVPSRPASGTGSVLEMLSSSPTAAANETPGFSRAIPW